MPLSPSINYSCSRKLGINQGNSHFDRQPKISGSKGRTGRAPSDWFFWMTSSIKRLLMALSQMPGGMLCISVLSESFLQSQLSECPPEAKALDLIRRQAMPRADQSAASGGIHLSGWRQVLLIRIDRSWNEMLLLDHLGPPLEWRAVSHQYRFGCFWEKNGVYFQKMDALEYWTTSDGSDVGLHAMGLQQIGGR